MNWPLIYTLKEGCSELYEDIFQTMVRSPGHYSPAFINALNPRHSIVPVQAFTMLDNLKNLENAYIRFLVDLCIKEALFPGENTPKTFQFYLNDELPIIITMPLEVYFHYDKEGHIRFLLVGTYRKYDNEEIYTGMIINIKENQIFFMM